MDEPFDTDLIYDVGAHLGEDSDFYLKLGYRVVAIEANPALAQHLRNRFAGEIAQGRFVLVEKAVAEQPGAVTFYVNELLSVWGTTNASRAERNRNLGAQSREVTVEALPFDAIVREHGIPHYIKIDIEGADMLCVKALAALDRAPEFVSIEAEENSWPDLAAEFDELAKLGYTRFQIVGQRKHRSGRFLARDGSPVTHVFEQGAAGPFGTLLEGPWLSRDQAPAKYRRILAINRFFGHETWFYRLMVRVPVLRRILYFVNWYDTHAAR